MEVCSSCFGCQVPRIQNHVGRQEFPSFFSLPQKCCQGTNQKNIMNFKTIHILPTNSHLLGFCIYTNCKIISLQTSSACFTNKPLHQSLMDPRRDSEVSGFTLSAWKSSGLKNPSGWIRTNKARWENPHLSMVNIIKTA